jgi:ABC-type dipeptide/oligopeptide/nickel transport system permease subunit
VTELAQSPAFEVAPAGLPKRRLRIPPSVAVAALVLAAIVAWALAPGLFAPGSPTAIVPTESLQAPTGAHPLGTDELGRDVLSRVIFGARSALLGPLIIATATLVLSTALSLLAGYYGGHVDAIVGRAVDVLYSLPPLIVAIVLVGVLGGGYWLAIAVLIVLHIPHNVRVLRAAVIERRHLPYVEAAESLGASPLAVMGRHLLPNILPTVAAAFFLRFTYGLVDLSSLSFLGLGVPPGSADWGRMLAENRVLVFENAWAALGPGVALVLTAVSANLVGDWLYERFERRARSR